jgi:cleavage and polyadenylation specificity factor subunit 4
MSDLWLDGDPALSPSYHSLSLTSFLDSTLYRKRQLYEANGGSFICKFFVKGNCARGTDCPYRHSRGDKPYVCKHWLRGLCKKGGDLCENLHIYELEKMAYCQFMIDFGVCTNVDCLFNHQKPEVEEIDCIWYARGFCRHGPLCKNRHIRKELCPDYLCGFCELGNKCEKGHPKWLLPEDKETIAPQFNESGELIPGSDKPRERTLRSLVGMNLPNMNLNNNNGNIIHEKPKPKSIQDMQCNICKQFGHLAGECPNRTSSDPSGKTRELTVVQVS